MYTITDIFESTSKREMISRFCNASRETFFANKKMPQFYDRSIHCLEIAILPPTHISRDNIIEALQSFIICENRSDIYGKIFSKVGKVICFYLLKNRQAMQNEVESITSTPISKNTNLKGVLQQTGRAVAVATGYVLSLIPQTKTYGVIIASTGSRLYLEDMTTPDSRIEKIINEIRKVDFNKLNI